MAKNCLYCGKELQFQRSTKKYCPGSCKQLAYYKRKAESLSGIPTENPITTAVQEDTTVKEPAIIKQDDFPASNNKEENKIPITESPSTDSEKQNQNVKDIIVKQKEKIPVVKLPDKKEEPYEWEESNFVEAIRTQIHGGDEELIFSNPERYWSGDTLGAVRWITQCLRCLIESMIQLSNRRYIDNQTLFELADAFNRLVGSYSFDFLPKNYPYTNLIKELRQKMNSMANANNDKEKIRFRLSPERKAKLIATRFIIADFVPKIKFSELELPIIKDKLKLF